MKDLTEIAIFVNTHTDKRIRNFHTKYWLATTIQTINPDFSRTFRNIYIRDIFPRVQIFLRAVYLYTLTRSHGMTSPYNRRIANNHQMENISSINRHKVQKYNDPVTDNAKYETKQKKKKNDEEKKRREDEKKR